MEIGNMLYGNSRGEFAVDRGLEQQFYDFLMLCDFDSYGVHKDFGREFRNDTFEVRPYYWGDCPTCDIATATGDITDPGEVASQHQTDCPYAKSNFVFKPTGLHIQWYKYPFRDSYSNQLLDKDMLGEIIDQCQTNYFRG